MHVGAFFDRTGRENDYLWGRLDRAQRLTGLLLGDESTPEERQEWCRKAFRATVQEEQPALASASKLLEHARKFPSK